MIVLPYLHYLVAQCGQILKTCNPHTYIHDTYYMEHNTSSLCMHPADPKKLSYHFCAECRKLVGVQPIDRSI